MKKQILILISIFIFTIIICGTVSASEEDNSGNWSDPVELAVVTIGSDYGDSFNKYDYCMDQNNNYHIVYSISDRTDESNSYTVNTKIYYQNATTNQLIANGECYNDGEMTGDAVGSPHITFNPSGIHISYYYKVYETGQESIMYIQKSWTSTTWSEPITIADFSSAINNYDFNVDKSNNYHIVYDTRHFESDNTLITELYYQNATSNQLIANGVLNYNAATATGMSGNQVSIPRIALSPSGIHISYSNLNGETSLEPIMYIQKSWTSTTWSEPVKIADFYMSSYDFCVDKSNNYHLVYKCNYVYGSEIKYYLYYKNATTNQLVAEGYKNSPHIAISPSGIHITYLSSLSTQISIMHTVNTVNKLPVLLIYGWHGSDENWDVIKPWLESDGYPVEILNIDDSLSADYLAEHNLKPKVAEMLITYNVSKVNLIAHSFGGLIARAYIEIFGGDQYVNNLIMMATPNHGSPLGDYLTGVKNDAQCSNIVQHSLQFIGLSRADKDWGSSKNLRTPDLINNKFLLDLNKNFNINNLNTNYFVIAGYGHYTWPAPIVSSFPQLLSYKAILTGHDDGVVQLESARLPGVPLYCVDLNHSSIVRPQSSILVNLYDQVIKEILNNSSPSPASVNMDVPVGSDPADSKALPNIVSSISGYGEQGGTYNHQINVNNGAVGLKFNLRIGGSDMDINLTDPNGRIITPQVAETDPNIDFEEGSLTDTYTIKNPISGLWNIQVQAIDVPVEGEAYTIETEIDTTPQISTIDPTNGATKVARNKTITITFNELIKFGTNNIKLVSSSGTEIPITTSISGKVLTIKHSALLATGTKYYVKLFTGCITDLAGNNLAGVSKYFTTTTDGTKPTVKSISPTHGSTKVARNKTIKLYFSEAVVKGTMNIKLVSSSGIEIPITKTISSTGTYMNLTHTALMKANTKYYVKIYTGSVTDKAGNPIAAKTFYFTTGST